MLQLPPDMFRQIQKDGLTLYTPTLDTATDNAAWTPENVWYRSRIEDENGALVSQGFPKFWNLEQGPEFGRVTVKDVLAHLEQGRPIVASLKLDGSLLIRSVWKGKVILRTRGAFGYEQQPNASEMELFRDKYPRLFDPAFCRLEHVLLEWTTPNNRIVLNYPKPDICIIGALAELKGSLVHANYHVMQHIASLLHIPVVHVFNISSPTEWEKFCLELEDRKDIEGYVLRLENEQKLVKVKTPSYITLHSLKSELSLKKVVEVWIQHGRIRQHDDILLKFRQLWDEECIMFILPYINTLNSLVDLWYTKLEEVKTFVSDKKDWTRKDFAIAAQKEYQAEKLWFGVAMQVWCGNDIPDGTIRSFMSNYTDTNK